MAKETETPAETSAPADQNPDSQPEASESVEQASATPPVDSSKTEEAQSLQAASKTLSKQAQVNEQIAEKAEATDGEPEPEAAEAEPEAEAQEEATEEVVLPPNISAEENTKYLKDLEDSGQLSQESYDELAAKGYTKEMVDLYLQGRQTTASNAESEFYETVGSKEIYTEKIIPWAAQNLTQESRDAFDQVMATGSKSEQLAAARALYQSYTEAEGIPAEKRVTGEVSHTPRTSTGLKPITSQAELTRLVASPEFSTSPAFQAEVTERAALGRKLGYQLT